MKIKYIFGIFILTLLGISVGNLIYQDHNVEDVKPSNNLLDTCPGFDFEKFVETGGSKIIRTPQEQINEVKRLNYICN